MSHRCPNCRMTSGPYMDGPDCPACRPREAGALYRFYCPTCAIVRDVLGPEPPICRHNVDNLAVSRMVPITPGHPLATGPLPWGVGDPARVWP